MLSKIRKFDSVLKNNLSNKVLFYQLYAIKQIIPEKFLILFIEFFNRKISWAI